MSSKTQTATAPPPGPVPPDIVGVLDESAPCYRGRAQSDVVQARSFALLQLARQGADQVLVPYIIEDLLTAQNPYALAAAAQALMHLSQVPPDAGDLLNRAELSLGLQDRIVDLDASPPRPGQGQSVRGIVQAVRRALAPKATCCESAATKLEAASDSLGAVSDVEVEDQDGHRETLGALMHDHHCLIAFFYTRCGNPLKCSQTVSNLGATHRALRAQGMAGFRLLGISYDPEFDLSARLRRYGQDRGLVFDAGCKLLRVPHDMASLHRELNLGVGFGPSTVNAHRLEWLLTNRAGKIRQSGARRHWNTDEILRAIAAEPTL